MKYIYLPIHLIQFWYLESFEFFFRTLKNSLLFLEEDLAVSLMWRLLFNPVFHDRSIGGFVISFIFRSLRIFIGLLAFLAVSILIIGIWILFLLDPILAIYFGGSFGLLLKIIFFSGVVLFVQHIVSHPHQKVAEIKQFRDAWNCSKVSIKDLNFGKLINSFEVTNLCWYLEINPSTFDQLKLTDDMELILSTSLSLGRQVEAIYLEPRHFFVSFLLTSSEIDLKLTTLSLTKDDLLDGLKFYEKKLRQYRRIYLWDEDFHITHLKGVNRGWLGVPTPVLDSCSEDLTKKAISTKVASFIGRQDVLTNIIHLLSGEGRKSVLLTGGVGLGKKSLVLYLAKMIVVGDAPPSLATKRVVRLDLAKLIGGGENQGDIAQRIKNLFEEIKYSENIILFIDTIEDFSELFPLITPYLNSDDFQFIATTSDTGLHKISENYPNLVEKFIKVELPASTKPETLEILQSLSIEAERYQKVGISIPAQKKIVEVAIKHIKDKNLPASAIDLFETVLKQADSGKIEVKDVDRVIYSTLKIPIVNSGAGNQLLLDLEELIHKRLIGQDEAVRVVAQTLKRAAVNLRDEARPIGSFLFVGPTGVGKTELSKILAEVYFKGAGQFIRFDMSEYQTDQSVDRLLGTAGNEGLLTDPIRHNPYALLLLDEFEKANSKILNLFLQVLDDGRLTDGAGQTVDFTNTIIIVTSNVGSLLIAQGIKDGKEYPTIKTEVFDELLRQFKPELVNRFDEVVVFKPLSNPELESIVTIKLTSLAAQLKNQGYSVEFDAGLIMELARKGFDLVLGARPLRRLIQDTIEARLSEMILRGTLQKGVVYKAGVDLLKS